MTSGVFIPLCCLFFSILLVFIYFSKKRIDTIETRLYAWLILVNLIGLIIEIPCYWMVRSLNMIPILATIILRAYLIYLITWIMIFTIYVHFISSDQTSEKFQQIKRFWIFLYWIFLVIVLVLPMKSYYDGMVGYTYGPAINAIYVISGLCIFSWFICMFQNYKHLKQKRYLPLFFFIIIGSILALVQMFYPGILLMTSMETFISFIMYFTIENPDIQVLRELHKARTYAENSNNEKSSFLFNITQQIREPLRDISRHSKEALMENDNQLIKKHLSEIKYSSKNALSLVNSVLDISEIENRKISVTNHIYQPSKLFDQLVRMIKMQVKEKKLAFRFQYDQSIPEYLNGDSLRIKQIVSALLENAVQYTEEGFIEISVNGVMKYDRCRLIITIEDSGKGIDRDQVETLFLKEKVDIIDDSKKNLPFIKTLIDLIGGTITVNSEIGRGSKFVVAIDQKIPLETENEVSKAVNQYEKMYVNTKRILIVTANETIVKKLSSILRKMHIEYDHVENGQDCLQKIRDHEQYELIFMDEKLPKLSSTDTFEKLKGIDFFNQPVVLMIQSQDIGTKDHYIHLGYHDTLGVPIHKEMVEQILKKYIQ